MGANNLLAWACAIIFSLAPGPHPRRELTLMPRLGSPCPRLGMAAGAQDRKVIRITAERFDFTPSRVTVKRGDVVEFRLRSEDTNHGFRILGSDVNLIIPKRGRGDATVIFRADTLGRYTFECSKMCGAGHSFMRGLITVED